MTNTLNATEKQINYLMKLGATAEQVKDLTIKAAAIMIGKLLKAQKEKVATTKEKVATVQEYKHGFKVGDILYASWGWEQTNLDFYKVVATTEKTIRIIEVSMKMKNEKAYSGMSRMVSFDPTTAEPVERSYEIKDQQKGDIKKINSYECNGETYYQIRLKHSNLYKYNGEELYESWYA